MSIFEIIRETLLMMGFAFIVGIAFAYILKAMIILFSCPWKVMLKTLKPRLVFWNGDAAISNASEVANSIESLSEYHFGSKNIKGAFQIVRPMEKLAEYHFGNKPGKSRPDTEMKRYYQFNHGKI